MSKLVVKDLVKIFGKDPKKALDLTKQGLSKNEIFEKTSQTVGVLNANFEVEAGEIFVIMGLSGSGKSTLLRLINRLIEPTSGKVYIDGEDVTAADREKLREIRRRKLGMVFQRFALFPHRSVLDNAAFGLEIQGVEEKERHESAYKALELVGLKGWEHSDVSQLSGGMQQRVGLARALASDPDILLMDEAFSALDPLIRKDMQDELLDIQSKMNKTIIFVTHDLDEALRIGDRIALMKDGEVVQIGNPEQILTNPANDYVERFVEDVDMSKVLTAEGIMKNPDVVVTTKDGPRYALRLMREKGLSSIFVTSRDRKLKGIVTADCCVDAVVNGYNDINRLIVPDVPKVSPDTHLQDIIPLLADSKYPVAVVNEEDKLLGVIVRGALLAGMIKKGGDEDGAA
ncbi:glycine betaine/proline transport system ATP-binding protein [Desulfohalotomaculum tongense]|uniref:quaternary amine ABC transporter ATP-binding protein n=1 Tax=Desulforadius tongensis TaxID=1216062 RepID=UPI00195DC2D9|nr:glycine betaine/L-proline ABC transporter ATP-binding protein [Desulforadius tongensis]MBM7855752.1 glycine betaine/proline transport system ATP-binding protein [Desulforadius tongensis]